MKSEHTILLNTVSDTLGVNSGAALALYSPAEIYQRTKEAGLECDWSALQELHGEARKEYDDLRILEKSLFTRASPLLPAAVTLGLKHPDVSLQDYEEWFGGRSDNYARPGDVSSMFSPAAYLTALYRESKSLYDTDSQWHIDKRRPDLQNLILSQKNMDTPVSALNLSNEILLAHIQTVMTSEGEQKPSQDKVLEALAGHVTSSSTPYHHHYSRLRQTRVLQDPDFSQLQAAESVTAHLYGPSLAAMYYDIPPALYKLLTDHIDEENAEEKFTEYFGDLTPEMLMDPLVLRQWSGLSDKELKEFIGSVSSDTYGNASEAEYTDQVLTFFDINNFRVTRLSYVLTVNPQYVDYLNIYPLRDDLIKIRMRFKTHTGLSRGRISINDKIILEKEVGYNYGIDFEEIISLKEEDFPGGLPETFFLNTARFYSTGAGTYATADYTVNYFSPALFFLKLNKAIRLYKATGLSPRVLEDVINSVNPDEITDVTLTLLFQTQILMQRYGISHEDALISACANISLRASDGNLSQFDRLFNLPPLDEVSFSLTGEEIMLHPEKLNEAQAGARAALKRACQTDDMGLYELGLTLAAGQGEQVALKTDISDVSRIYALSLWARLHGLTPATLRQLLTMLGLPQCLCSADIIEWNTLLEKLHAATEWISARGLTVYDLMLMTRDVTGLAASTEITNFIRQLRETVQASDAHRTAFPAAEDEELAARITALAPVVTTALNLNSEAAAMALIRWADKASPEDKGLDAVWQALQADTLEVDNALVINFAYTLAQMAMIYHVSGANSDAFSLFVNKPGTLLSQNPEVAPQELNVLARTVPVIMALTGFSEWIKRLPSATGSSVSISALLNNEGVDAGSLSLATGKSEMLITQAIAQAEPPHDDKKDRFLTSYSDIQTVMQWVTLSEAFNVTPVDISNLLALSAEYAPPKPAPGESPEIKESASSWDAWKAVANVFAAGLPPARTEAMEQTLSAPLSAALSGYLMDISSIARDREGLYRYLLADNLNGPQITTSRLAEALASLQLFIHRALNLMDDTQESAELKREVFDRQFFRDWVQWNARFSTWAGAQKLMYYPENYIDPTVRLGQTSMMDEMLQVLGQAQINTDSVGDAFMGYLTGFEEVANLETVSGFHDKFYPDEGKTWFVGRNQMTPPEYWWRSLDEDKRSPDGELPANAWTGWNKIDAALQPTGNLVRPVVYKERLYLGWVERKKIATARDNEGKETEWRYSWELKMSWLRYDGGWSQPVTYIYPDTTELENLLQNTDIKDLSLYLSVWPEKQQMVAGIYKKGFDSAVSASDFTGRIAINEDMSFEIIEFSDDEWDNFTQALDVGNLNKVLTPYYPSRLFTSGPLETPSVVPDGFSRFDYSELKVSVVDVDPFDQTYKIKMGLNQIVALESNLKPSSALIELLNLYPDLRSESESCKAIHSQSPGDLNGLWAVLHWGYVQFYVLFKRKSINPVWTHIYSKDFQLEEISINNETYLHGTYSDYETLYSGIKNPYDLNFRIFTGVTNLLRSFRSVFGETGFITSEFKPNEYKDLPDVIPKGEVKSTITTEGDETEYEGYTATRDLNLIEGTEEYQWRESIYPSSSAKFKFPGSEVFHTVELTCGNNKKRTWKLRVHKLGQTRDLMVSFVSEKVTDGQRAQYLQHGQIRTRLNTLFARQLTEKAARGIDTILNYSTQSIPSEPPVYEDGDWSAMDFSGANAIYFWELFYYTPMMIMQRFLQEENFDLAEKWLKYIFSPSGYIIGGKPDSRIWNVRPLNEDTSWNDEPLKSVDPDAIAQNDPMHYKLHTFMRQLDIIIGKGDAAYRRMERDTFVEAKVWYMQALTLLGEAPWIKIDSVWHEPNLGSAASDSALTKRIDTLSQIAKGIRSSKDSVHAAGTTMFLPEVNEVMLGYWETLRIRLYNLRHNLTIDGQPLNLPLFASPADPKALLAAAVMAEGGADSTLPSITGIAALRFTPMLESARSMASQLIQFGSTMQQILVAQDAEALSELLNTQGASLAASSVTLQEQTLRELAAERSTLEKSIDAVKTRRDHYKGLYQENLNAREIHSMDLLTASETMGAAIKPLYVAGAAAGIAPNIFGLANGGMKYDGPLNAMGIGLEIVASGLHIAGSRIQQEEMYRRRREEWDIQYRSAEKEIQGLEAQLTALSVRETSAKMQIAYMKTQSQHATALLEQFQSKFTSKAMYSWLRGRLATIYYQYYDLTASLCLMTEKALQWEKGDLGRYLKTGTWTGAWSGLMAGEGLMLSLAQMEMAWMKHQKRELEVTRTVSLAAFFDGKLGDDSLASGISKLLNGQVMSAGEDDNKLVYHDDTDELAIHFNLKELDVAPDYTDKKVRVRSISVTLPALLGPYQNVKARLRTDANGLPVGCNECAISEAIHDNGLFINDGSGDPRWGARWLPFEGLDLMGESGMTLSFAGATADQKALLESLSDVILHIQFTVR